jgi:hypothetical protein
MTQAWDADEVTKTVDAYFRMLDLELRGEPFKKADFYWRLSDDLGRTKGSVERKFGNISAILVESGATYISGYKPYKHVQQLLRETVEERFAQAHDLRKLMVRAAESPEDEPVVDLQLEIPVPQGLVFPNRAARRGRVIDFNKLEAENKKRGDYGEKLVVNRERRKLSDLGRDDLAHQVRHVSVEDGDGLGYDVLSFTPDGEKRFLEVKTTVRSEYQPFYVSSNEVDFSDEEPSRFSLVRVFSIHDRPSWYELHGSLRESAQLVPDSYLGLPRVSGQ